MIKLLQLEKQLKTARTLEVLNKILSDYLQQYQISLYAFTYYSYHPNSAHKIKYHFASKPYQPWHNHYLSEGYEDIDTTLNFTHQHTLPTYWELPEQLRTAKNQREKQMRLDSIAFGLEKGLCIPIHGPSEDFAVLLVAQKKGENCLAQWPMIQYELLIAGYLYYHYLQKHMAEALSDSQQHLLTQRELQILLLVSKQLSVSDIANKIHLTERTVNYHIQKINKKLGVRNKHQAVSKAIATKIIVL